MEGTGKTPAFDPKGIPAGRARQGSSTELVGKTTSIAQRVFVSTGKQVGNNTKQVVAASLIPPPHDFEKRLVCLVQSHLSTLSSSSLASSALPNSMSEHTTITGDAIQSYRTNGSLPGLLPHYQSEIPYKHGRELIQHGPFQSTTACDHIEDDVLTPGTVTKHPVVNPDRQLLPTRVFSVKGQQRPGAAEAPTVIQNQMTINWGLPGMQLAEGQLYALVDNRNLVRDSAHSDWPVSHQLPEVLAGNLHKVSPGMVARFTRSWLPKFAKKTVTDDDARIEQALFETAEQMQAFSASSGKEPTKITLALKFKDKTYIFSTGGHRAIFMPKASGQSPRQLSSDHGYSFSVIKPGEEGHLILSSENLSHVMTADEMGHLAQGGDASMMLHLAKERGVHGTGVVLTEPVDS